MIYASYLLTRSCETSWEDVPWRVLAIKMAKKTFNSPIFLSVLDAWKLSSEAITILNLRAGNCFWLI